MMGFLDRWQGELFITGSLSTLVPDDYILKRVDRVLELSWLRDEVKELYAEEQGRPSIDPEAALRLMLAGFFLGLIYDRTLLREAQVNLAVRWFAGYRLDEQLPHHSSLTRIRSRWGAKTFKSVFQRSVRQCIQAGLVSGETVHIDATLTRANVSWDSYSERHAEKVLQENPLEEPSPENRPSSAEPEAQSAGHPTGRRSLTDPDATLATTQRNRRLMPAYKQHLAVDDQAGVIVDVVTTTGCANEGEQILAQVDRVRQLLPARIHSITADSGYAYGKVYAGLEERRIQAVIPAKREWCNKNVIPLKRFKYDGRHHIVRCPRGKILTRSCKTKHGWYYRSACSDCNRCDLRARCLSRNSSNRRTVVISDGYEALLRARRAKGRWTPERNRAYYRHRWRSEGVNSEAKRIHGLHRAVRRRQSNVEIQAFLTGSAINLKRLAA